jgi:hypothetical protein
MAMLAFGPVQAQIAPNGSTPGSPMPAAGVTTGALADLCATGSDSTDTAAAGYCRGFLIGVGQYHAEMTSGQAARPPIFCLPDPSPTVASAQASFAAWAKANPQHAGEKAVDGLMRWAAATYPCPTEPRAAAAGRGRR